ncbi:eppin-like [Antechinus flavipes]|uniref:eppin-like n=1 Tax=Antechinus flavipes TaxID=38775 RepID=UPI00223647F4|nr:eppin-like [Antechinus flavipes]
MGTLSFLLFPFLFLMCLKIQGTQITRADVNNRSCPKVKVHCIYKETDVCDFDSNCPGSQKCCLFSCGRKCMNFTEVTCKLPADPGPCLASIMRWAYDDEIKDCVKFIYGGCEGNNNNFQTQKICRKTCKALGKHRKPYSN